MTDTDEVGRVPIVLRYVSLVVLVAAVAMTVAGAWRVGVTWDEPIHVQRLNNYLHTGWFLGEGQLDHGQPRSTVTQQYVYAPAAMLLLHALGVLTGAEGSGAASVTAHAYAVRHLGIALVGIVGILAVMGIARLVFRRWDWALVAGATIAVMPMWTGYSMFNVKDVPVGTGCTLATLGLALLAREEESRSWRVRLAGPAVLAGGIFLAVGTRPGIWTCIAAGTGVLVMCLLLRPGHGSPFVHIRHDAWRYRDLVAGYVLGFVALYLIDPKVFDSPVHTLVRSAYSTATFLGADRSWTFVPIGVLLQLPALMLAFIAVSMWSLTRQLMRVRLRPGVVETRLLLVVAQAFTLPFLAIVHSSSLYGDLRQLLFAAPAAAVLVTYGMHRVLTAARTTSDRRNPAMVAGVACVALVAPLVEQAPLFPYNYTYYNVFASIADVPLLGDYYRASGREIASKLPATGRLVCSAAIDKDQNAMRMAHLDGWVDCRSALMSPISAYLAPGDGVDLGALEDDQFWNVSFGGRDVPKNCTKVTRLTRHLRWTTVRMATLAKCSRPFPVVSNAELRMSSVALRALSVFDQGWLLPLTDGAENGVLSRDAGPGSMTFRLSSQFAGHKVTLVVDTAWPTTVPEVTFGGAAVSVTQERNPSRLEIAVPRGLVDRGTREPLTLEFSPHGGSLDLKVLGVRAQIA